MITLSIVPFPAMIDEIVVSLSNATLTPFLFITTLLITDLLNTTDDDPPPLTITSPVTVISVYSTCPVPTNTSIVKFLTTLISAPALVMKLVYVPSD